MPMRDSDVKWMHKQGNKMDVDDKLVDPSKLPKTPEEMLDLVVELLKKNPRIADEIAKGVAMGTAAPSELPPPPSPGPQGPQTPGQAKPGQATPGPQGQAAPGPSPQGQATPSPAPVQLSPAQRNSLAAGLGRAQSSLQSIKKPAGQSGGAPGNANKPPPITVSSPAGATPGKAPQTSPNLTPNASNASNAKPPQTGPQFTPNASNAKPPQTGPPNAPGPQVTPNAPGPQGPPPFSPNASSTGADTKVVRFGDTAIFGTASISGLFAADPADPSKKQLLNADNFAAYLQYLLGRAVQCLGQQFEEGDAAGCGQQLSETIASDLRTDAGHSLVQSAINLAAANNNTPEEQRLVTFELDDAAAPTTLSATIGGKPGEFSLDLGAYKDEYAPVIMMDFVMYAFCRANQVVASSNAAAAPPPSTAITQDALKEALRAFEKGKSAVGGGKKKSKRARRVEPILAIFQMAKSAPLPRRKRSRKALAKKPIAKKTGPKKKNNKTLQAKTAAAAKKKKATVARRAK